MCAGRIIAYTGPKPLLSSFSNPRSSPSTSVSLRGECDNTGLIPLFSPSIPELNESNAHYKSHYSVFDGCMDTGPYTDCLQATPLPTTPTPSSHFLHIREPTTIFVDKLSSESARTHATSFFKQLDLRTFHICGASHPDVGRVVIVLNFVVVILYDSWFFFNLTFVS